MGMGEGVRKNFLDNTPGFPAAPLILFLDDINNQARADCRPLFGIVRIIHSRKQGAGFHESGIWIIVVAMLLHEGQKNYGSRNGLSKDPILSASVPFTVVQPWFSPNMSTLMADVYSLDF